MAELFISYARADQGFARDLIVALQKLQRDTWIDWRSIPDSAQWRAEIFAAIEAADNFLFIISPDSLRSWMCGQEVAHAVANNKRIITILYHPVDHDELLPGLKEIQWIDYPELGFEQTFQRLITALDTDLEWVRQHTRLGLRAAQWEASDRDVGFLLHGMELREAIRWLEQSSTMEIRQPTKVHQQYIRFSEDWEAGEIQRLRSLQDDNERLRQQAEKLRRETLVREHNLMTGRHALRIFLCHASEDKPAAQNLHQRLHEDGYRPWLDEKDLIAGQDWKEAIRTALRMSHVTLILLSQESVKKAGFVQREIKFARKIGEEKPEGVIFLIPVRLDQCDVPPSLRSLHRIDFFQPDGYVRLLRALDERLESALQETLARLPSVERSDLHIGPASGTAGTSHHDGDVGTVIGDLPPDAKELLIRAQDDRSYAISTTWFETIPQPRLSRLKTSHLQIVAVDPTDEVHDWQRALEHLHQHCLILPTPSKSPHKSFILTRDGWAVAELVRQSLGDLTREVEQQRQKAEWQRQDADLLRQRADKASRQAVARALAAFSMLSLEVDLERSTLLAMYAVNATRSIDGTVVPEAEDVLQKVVLQSRIRLTLRGHSYAVLGVAVSGDGKLAVSASADGTLKVWEVNSGRELRTLQGHASYVNGVAVTAAGWLAVSASADKTLKVWEVESGRELRTMRGHSGWVNGVALSGDGRLAVSASEDKTLKVWEVESGRELRTLEGHTAAVNGVALSGDGRLAVSASEDKTLKVWEVESGRELHTLTGHSERVHSVAVTPDGNLGVSASDDKTLKVWETGIGRELVSLHGHSDRVLGVALSPDGTRVASAAADNSVRIWETDRGRELITLAGHTLPVHTVAWSADGGILLSGGEDYMIQSYAMDIDLLMSLARSRVTRNLTPEECRKYLHRDDVPPIP